MNANEVHLVVAGAGLRGLAYARRAAARGARITAVAEPDPQRRTDFAAEFQIPPERAFADWRELAAAGRIGDAAVIALQDRLHADAAVDFAALGYHLLLEKPMATTESDARRITAAVEEAGVIFAVCHVLRYTAYTRALRRLIDDGALGRLVDVQHLEPIGWWHFAHSFVRGHWSNSQTSAPLLLTKACHDIDWLMHLFDAAPTRVSSFGSLAHFRAEERPPGAADRCVDCPVEPACPYSAARLYRSCLGDPDREFWPLSAVTDDRTPAGVERALREGPYGRCVYTCDNDVVDHQVVAMEFPGGATCSFTMSAFTPMEHRRTRLSGTRGHAEGDGRRIRVVDFATGAERVIDTHASGAAAGDGHGGGDDGIIDAFVEAVASGDPALLHSDAATSLAGHLVVWAAERARETGTVVTL
jgi:predicted dehydrogenase